MSMLKETGLEQIAPRTSCEPLSVRPPAEAGRFSEVLSPGALTFTAVLASRFEGERQRLVAQRPALAQARGDERHSSTREAVFMRESPWKLAQAPTRCQTRTVSPGEFQLSAGARRDGETLLVVDFGGEPETSFDLVMLGHRNLREAARGQDVGRASALALCPRPFDLQDPHFRTAEEPLGAALVDVALYLFHCAHAASRRGSSPHVCLSGLHHHLEARWWCRLIEAAEHTLGLARGAIEV
ncbi:MAG TPA: hypothetical protein VMF89_20390, partial [Polyangiales bacterium]|nr:hypothetical protein [Polyangiales bacterium]